MLMSATPTRAFFIGAGVITVSVKSWVFTLAAISVIGNAAYGAGRQHRVLRRLRAACHEREPVHHRRGCVFPATGRAPLLDRILRWLQEKDRPIMVVVGLVFGLWFGLKALRGFGIL